VTASAKPRKCMYCRQNQVVPTVLPSYVQEMEHDGRKYSITLTDFHVLECQNCHEFVLDDCAEETLTEALRAKAGLLSPAAIREARESLGYTQQQLADYLRISMYTLSRWETGAQIQQRGMDALLRVFFQSPEARRILGVLEREFALAGNGVGRAD
jgi:putative zinc finger/helix-turn-helix YgiT family protein